MILCYVPVLTATPPTELILAIIGIVILLFSLFSSPSTPQSSSSITYRSTEQMVEKYKGKETIKMLARELRNRECLGKIGFDPRGYVLIACKENKASSVFTYSFRELSDIEFSPGEQEAILRALIYILPDEYDYKLYYEQSISSKYPHFFYMKSRRYRKAESDGSL